MGFRKEKEGKKERAASVSSEGSFYQVFQPSSDAEDVTARGLSVQLAQKTADLERLRKYITQLEEGEKGVAQELSRQLAAKDAEIGRLSALYSGKDAEHRRLSQTFEGHVLTQRESAERIKELILRKEQENIRKIEQLQAQLAQKDLEISSLRNSPFTAEKLSRMSQQRLEQQIQEMSMQLSQLKAFIAEKETHARSLEAAFESTLAAKDSELNRLKHSAGRHHQSAYEMSQSSDQGERIMARVQRELESRNAEVASLREQLAAKGLSSAPGRQSFELDRIRMELEEKSHSEKKLERALAEEQRLGRETQQRLKEQIASMQRQMEELKSFLIDKERVMQSLEAAFEKRLAAKDDEVRHLKGAIVRKPESHLRSEMGKLESEVQVKEEASKMMAEEIARLKEQSGLLRKRLDERQRLYFESEKAYEELIGKLREQHESRIKSLVQESSQKEAALRTAVEEERVRLQQEKSLMKEKSKQIDETLQAFSATSQRLIKLGSPTDAGVEMGDIAAVQQELSEREKALEERKNYIESKEAEVKALLDSTEEKIAELKSKEVTIERKEQILLQEQEALNKELDVLSNAGVEISKSKEYLKQKLQQVDFTGQFTPRQPQSREASAEIVPEPQFRQPTKKSSTQDFGFAPSEGVQEAQEEEDFTKPKFTGVASSQGPVSEAMEEATDSLSSGASQDFANPKPSIPLARKIVASTRIKGKIQKPATKASKQQMKSKQKIKILPRKQQLAKKSIKPALSQKKHPAAAARKISSASIRQGALPSKHGEQELFTEMGGYSEIDEIKSIVEVGLQHGDSREQIRESLLTSGYSKQNIEKVLSQVK